jgi:3-oxoacyl-[acyl-carrier protein] reductase
VAVTDPSPRVALVAGASQGLGAAIARRLGRDGYAVVLASRSLERCGDVVAAMTAERCCASAVSCDVTRASDVEAAVARTVDEHGALHVLVNSAGITRDNLIHKMTDDEWHDVIATNLTGSFFLARAAQRPMVRQRYGKILFLGSTASAGNRGQTNYSAAKAGLQGMTRTLALELGPFGINVNLLSPGHVDTPMTRALASRRGVDYEQIREDRIAGNSIKRVGDPDDIANVAAFLVSDESSYLTGQTITVSGKPSIS